MTSPEYFLRGALDLFVRNYSRLKILLGLGIVGSGYGVGLSSSFEQPVRTLGDQLGLAAVRITGVLRPVDAQQAQGEAERDPDHHRAERADDRNKCRESHGGGPRSHPPPKKHSPVTAASASRAPGLRSGTGGQLHIESAPNTCTHIQHRWCWWWVGGGKYETCASENVRGIFLRVSSIGERPGSSLPLARSQRLYFPGCAAAAAAAARLHGAEGYNREGVNCTHLRGRWKLDMKMSSFASFVMNQF